VQSYQIYSFLNQLNKIFKMDNEKNLLGKKRQANNLTITKLEDDGVDINIINPGNNIIKNELNKLPKQEENLNLIQNNNKNNALTLNDQKNNSAFINKLETSIPLNLNNSKNSILTFGKSFSFQNTNNSEQIGYQVPIPNPQLNPQLNQQINPIIKKKMPLQNSTFSDNSESLSQSQEDSPKNESLKLKSNLQTSRNTAFGLKEISKRVMDIIKQSGKTTYKAISDQIVNEINEKSLKDEKNIRRRIYDSLNVMKSMKLFNRDKNTKTIMWNYGQEFDPLNEIEDKSELNEKNDNKIDSGDIASLKKEIKEKNNKLELLKMELIGLKNVLERNAKENEKIPEQQKLYFPFIVIEFPSNKDPKINVALNDNKTKAHFGFDEVISMYGDLDAVSKIGNHPNFSKIK
jgi:hypothetical protein